MFRVKERSGRSIDQHTERRGGDTSHDPSDERVRETQMYEEHLDIKPANLIESFFQIYF